MTVKVYIGSTTDIGNRIAGAPNSTTTTVATVTSKTVFTLTSSTSFSAGDTIAVGKYRGVIDALDGVEVTLQTALTGLPTIGDTVAHYNADFTNYRDQTRPFQFIDDRKTGGRTGSEYVSSTVSFLDQDYGMLEIKELSRIAVFDDQDTDTCLFGGAISRVSKTPFSKDRDGNLIYQWDIEAHGYAYEADNIGIEEPPAYNVNAGAYLRYLMNKYTTLTEGEIDTTNSPIVDFIRLGNFKRFTEVGQQLESLWPEGEFFIKNTNTGGEVYFRQQSTIAAPMTLNTALINYLGNYNGQGVSIQRNYDNLANIVRFPFYQEQWRAPDLFVQSTTANIAYLKHSVVLNGTPSSVEEATLVEDGFTNELPSDFLEYDIDNPSPPSGFNNSDGFLISGEVNTVKGLHLIDATGESPSFGDIGRITNPAEIEPFTGQERQIIFLQELVVNTLGDAIVFGIIDQTNTTATIESGATTSSLPVDDSSGFVVGDRVTVDGEKSYVTSNSSNTLGISPVLSSAPDAGDTVSLHDLALSRIKFGIKFTAAGAIEQVIDGVASALDTPQTYEANETYSLRLYMEAVDAVINGSPTSTSLTVQDATGLATGDIVQVFSQGEKLAPEERAITVSGSTLSFSSPLSNIPQAGYRIRSLPKIVVQIKGGAFSDVTSRDWTTIYTAPNTYQTQESTLPDDRGIVLFYGKSLEATLTNFWVKNPIPVSAKISTRYLHIGTQETETSEPDVDCLLRKVGSHFQLDFFPDTVELWGSGETLELRYKERWLTHLDVKDTESMRTLAFYRGFTLPDEPTEEELTRKGGRVLDTIQTLPSPLTIPEAITQARSIILAAKDPAYITLINTTTEHHTRTEAGMTLGSEYEDVPSLLIERVQMTEIAGVSKDGASMWQMAITAGSIDRLKDVLVSRLIRSGQRLVIDDGSNDDTYTRLQQVPTDESIEFTGVFTTQECDDPTQIVYDGVDYVEMICLDISYEEPE